MEILGFEIKRRTKPKKVKRDKKNRRIYEEEFNGETIIIKSVTRGLENELIRKHKIYEHNAQVNYFYEQATNEEDEAEKANLENLYFAATGKLELAAFECGQAMCRDAVQKPKTWFDDLSREEWANLIVTVRAVLNRWPIPQMYMELHHDLVGYFRVNKSKSNFTGKEVAKLMEMRRAEYESLDVKKNNLKRALKAVEPRTVRTAITT